MDFQGRFLMQNQIAFCRRIARIQSDRKFSLPRRLAEPRMSGTYDWPTSDDVYGEWTALDNSFCLEQSGVSPPIDLYRVKATMSYYNSLSTSGASPLCEWIDDHAPHDLVNCWIQLHVPNGSIPNRPVPSKDVFIPFIVYGYDDGCHLIESFHFKSERTKVDLTRLYAPCIRYQGGRKFLSEIRPRSDIVKTTLDFYNSLSKNNTGPLCEWVDDPQGLVNSCIELRVPNSDSFMMFTVNGYYNGFHLIESFAFKALRSEVNLTLLPSGSIRQTGDRVFLSEIVPQSDIMDAVKELADEVTEAADAQSDIVDAVKELGDEVTEAYLDRIRRRYIAEKYKKRDELAEVARKLALETQQRDWEKQQKEKKEQRKLKKAQEKSKKEEQKKKKK